MGRLAEFARPSRRADSQGISWEEFQDQVIQVVGGGMYPLLNQTLLGDREQIGTDFCGLAAGALKSSGVVWACIDARMSLFSEARFQFRSLNSDGRPGKLFGTPALRPLEKPWPNGTTGDLLARKEIEVSLAGNSYTALRPGGQLASLRPDWVDIVLGSNTDSEVEGYDIDAQIIGFVYYPGGRGSDEEPEMLLPDEVAHYAPKPDPDARFRGMSWLTPIIREIQGDKATTAHKNKYFEHGATPNLKVSFDISDPVKFDKWVEKFKETHSGNANAFKTLFLASGMDAEPIGSNLKDIDFTKVQGGGELRIASAAGVPASIVGLAKSLEGAALNNDAKDSARRRFGELTIRPLWRNVCGSFAHLIDVPPGSELWYDPRDIAFLKDDIKDAAEAVQMQAATISTLVSAGYEPDSVVTAVNAGDLTLLVHTGLVSVQLLPPGTDVGGNDHSNALNGHGPSGNGNGSAALLTAP
jgi:hypothetical protein